MFKMKTLEGVLVPLVVLVIVLYTTYRAAVLSFTHDECLSYLNYVPLTLSELFSKEVYYTNNHLLNTILIKVSKMLFGNSEFVLRLPNLFALVIYIVFSLKILKHISPGMRVIALSLLLLNPYLLDFFGLARGYGLSIGFMIMSLYFLLDYVADRKINKLAYYNVAAILATLSNFSLLYYYFSSLFVLNLFLLCKHRLLFFSFSKKENIWNTNYLNVLFLALLALFIYNPISKIISAKLIVFGGKKGFLADTIVSLIDRFAYGQDLNTGLLNVLGMMIVVAVLLYSSYLFYLMIRRNPGWDKNQNAIIVNFVLLFIGLGTVMSHLLFDTDFLKERFALFLIPLFVLNIGLFLDHLFKVGNKKPAMTLGIILTLSFVFNFVKHANLSHTCDWKYDMDTKNVLKLLIDDTERLSSSDKKKITMANYWIFEPSLNFYRTVWELEWLEPFDREGINVEADYYYTFQNKLPTDYLEECSEITRCPESRTVLLKRE